MTILERFALSGLIWIVLLRVGVLIGRWLSQDFDRIIRRALREE